MSEDARFDAALPTPHTGNWKQAHREDQNESPRLTSYQPPGGQAVTFILNSFRFSGGHSKDTAEYPFDGLWSNEYLNEKPQELNVEGFLRGTDYIVRRNTLIEALRIPTCDGRPGYIDLPFWGRFPVVVGDNYEVSESADEQGQCRVSIPFTRAGISIETRAQEEDNEQSSEIAAARLEAAAVEKFEADLNPRIIDISTLRAGFGQIANSLLSVTGRIQGARTILNTVTGNVLGLLSLINQGVASPRLFALALFNAAAEIAGGIIEIRNSAARYRRFADNERNVLLIFLSADAFRLFSQPATVSQDITIAAVENLYRTMAFVVSAKIIAGMEFLTHESAEGCWRLLERLEGSIDKENTAVHAALRDTMAALSQRLSLQKLSAEMTRRLPSAAPILYLAHYLGSSEDALRRLNRIADSFAVEGDIVYV